MAKSGRGLSGTHYGSRCRVAGEGYGQGKVGARSQTAERGQGRGGKGRNPAWRDRGLSLTTSPTELRLRPSTLSRLIPNELHWETLPPPGGGHAWRGGRWQDDFPQSTGLPSFQRPDISRELGSSSGNPISSKAPAHDHECSLWQAGPAAAPDNSLQGLCPLQEQGLLLQDLKFLWQQCTHRHERSVLVSPERPHGLQPVVGPAHAPAHPHRLHSFLCGNCGKAFVYHKVPFSHRSNLSVVSPTNGSKSSHDAVYGRGGRPHRGRELNWEEAVGGVTCRLLCAIRGPHRVNTGCVCVAEVRQPRERWAPAWPTHPHPKEQEGFGAGSGRGSRGRLHILESAVELARGRLTRTFQSCPGVPHLDHSTHLPVRISQSLPRLDAISLTTTQVCAAPASVAMRTGVPGGRNYTSQQPPRRLQHALVAALTSQCGGPEDLRGDLQALGAVATPCSFPTRARSCTSGPHVPGPGWPPHVGPSVPGGPVWSSSASRVPHLGLEAEAQEGTHHRKERRGREFSPHSEGTPCALLYVMRCLSFGCTVQNRREGLGAASSSAVTGSEIGSWFRLVEPPLSRRRICATHTSRLPLLTSLNTLLLASVGHVQVLRTFSLTNLFPMCCCHAVLQNSAGVTLTSQPTPLPLPQVRKAGQALRAEIMPTQDRQKVTLRTPGQLQFRVRDRLLVGKRARWCRLGPKSADSTCCVWCWEAGFCHSRWPEKPPVGAGGLSGSLPVRRGLLPPGTTQSSLTLRPGTEPSSDYITRDQESPPQPTHPVKDAGPSEIKVSAGLYPPKALRQKPSPAPVLASPGFRCFLACVCLTHLGLSHSQVPGVRVWTYLLGVGVPFNPLQLPSMEPAHRSADSMVISRPGLARLPVASSPTLVGPALIASCYANRDAAMTTWGWQSLEALGQDVLHTKTWSCVTGTWIPAVGLLGCTLQKPWSKTRYLPSCCSALMLGSPPLWEGPEVPTSGCMAEEPPSVCGGTSDFRESWGPPQPLCSWSPCKVSLASWRQTKEICKTHSAQRPRLWAAEKAGERGRAGRQWGRAEPTAVRASVVGGRGREPVGPGCGDRSPPSDRLGRRKGFLAPAKSQLPCKLVTAVPQALGHHEALPWASACSHCSRQVCPASHKALLLDTSDILRVAKWPGPAAKGRHPLWQESGAALLTAGELPGCFPQGLLAFSLAIPCQVFLSSCPCHSSPWASLPAMARSLASPGVRVTLLGAWALRPVNKNRSTWKWCLLQVTLMATSSPPGKGILGLKPQVSGKEMLPFTSSHWFVGLALGCDMLVSTVTHLSSHLLAGGAPGTLTLCGSCHSVGGGVGFPRNRVWLHLPWAAGQSHAGPAGEEGCAMIRCVMRAVREPSGPAGHLPTTDQTRHPSLRPSASCPLKSRAVTPAASVAPHDLRNVAAPTYGHSARPGYTHPDDFQTLDTACEKFAELTGKQHSFRKQTQISGLFGRGMSAFYTEKGAALSPGAQQGGHMFKPQRPHWAGPSSCWGSFHFPPLWVGPLAAPPCMVPATHQSQPPVSMSQLHTTKRALP
ncbi:hypothetical protein Cadr_000012390 [Camelus dromedarius]|uniref:Uncharacterized protein n=1 Tax=Camelus dromedarius TaxID=9838 RepID=A0A5N4DU35_CAMDR|nr:hypothetical protein Cadr_000012390 [Camelus dromedarius]